MRLIRCDGCGAELVIPYRESIVEAPDYQGWQVDTWAFYRDGAARVPDLCPTCKALQAADREVFDFANAERVGR